MKKRIVSVGLAIILLLSISSSVSADSDILTFRKKETGIVCTTINSQFPDLTKIFAAKDAPTYVVGMTAAQVETLLDGFLFEFSNNNTVVAYIGISNTNEDVLLIMLQNTDKNFLAVSVYPSKTKILVWKSLLTRKEVEKEMKSSCVSVTKITGKQMTKANEIVAGK